MKFRIIFKSFNKKKIHFISEKAKFLLLKSNYISSGVISIPTKIKKFCVLRSPHANKDSREHFELRMYKKFIDVKTTSLEILNVLLQFKIPVEISSTIEFC